MGTDLYQVRVEKIEGQRAWMRVTPLSTDVGLPASDAVSFGLHLLLEAYWELQHGDLRHEPYAAAAVAEHPAKAEISGWLTLMNGERKVLSKADFESMKASFDAEDAELRAAVSSLGLDSVDGTPCYSVTYRPSHREFHRLADRMFLDMNLEGETFELKLRDATMLAHLRPEMSFASRAYDHERA
jgi:hypothetical protein